MQWTRLAATVAMLAALSGGLFGFQDLPAQNPLDGNADAIRAGMGLFRGRCADCHGMDAHGVRGPDITQVWASGRTDDGLFKIVSYRKHPKRYWEEDPAQEKRFPPGTTVDDVINRMITILQAADADV